MRWLVVMPYARAGRMGMDFAEELRALGHDVDTFAYRRDNVLYKNKSTKAAYQRALNRRLERLVPRRPPRRRPRHQGRSDRPRRRPPDQARDRRARRSISSPTTRSG